MNYKSPTVNDTVFALIFKFCACAVRSKFTFCLNNGENHQLPLSFNQIMAHYMLKSTCLSVYKNCCYTAHIICGLGNLHQSNYSLLENVLSLKKHLLKTGMLRLREWWTLLAVKNTQPKLQSGNKQTRKPIIMYLETSRNTTRQVAFPFKSLSEVNKMSTIL